MQQECLACKSFFLSLVRIFDAYLHQQTLLKEESAPTDILSIKHLEGHQKKRRIDADFKERVVVGAIVDKTSRSGSGFLKSSTSVTERNKW